MNAHKLRVLALTACLLPIDLAVAAALLLAQIAVLPLSAFRRVATPWTSPDTSKVTIQILNWDGRDLLEEFLPSVLAAAGDHDILIADNGSTDGSVELIKSRFPKVRLLELDRNYGFSIGNNLGVEQVQTDIVVFLNNDMSVDSNFLQPLLQPFSDPAVFAVASRITVPDAAKAAHETGKTRARFERGLFYFWHEAAERGDESRNAIPVFWAGGGACAVDRRRFRLLGGFDSLYHPFYVEDADLSFQAWKRGWRSVLAPGSRVVHRHRGTSSRKFGEAFVNNTTRRNHYLFVWKNLTDTGLLLEHVLMLPWIHGRAISQYGGRFEITAYLRACVWLPRAIVRRLANVRSYELSDRDVLGLAQ